MRLRQEKEPVPMAALVIANCTTPGTSTYDASYVSAGFPGAVVEDLITNAWSTL